MLDVENLTYQPSPGRTLVGDASFFVSPGEILGVMGASGSGKTTLLRLLSGLISPTSSGRLTIGGRDVLNLYPSHRPISFMQQDYPLYGHLSAIENVLVGGAGSRAGRASGRVREEAEDLLTRLFIEEDVWTRNPGTLSGGEAQRVALAKALSKKDAEVLLLDEPLGNLNRVTKRDVLKVIWRQVTDRQQACVLVSHDERDLLLIADRLAIMEAGAITQVGSPESIWKNPVSLEAASLGSFFSVQVAPLSTSAPKAEDGTSMARNSEWIAWRVEDATLEVDTESHAPKNGVFQFKGIVSRGFSLGGREFYQVASKEGRTIWHVQAKHDREPIERSSKVVLEVSSWFPAGEM